METGGKTGIGKAGRAGIIKCLPALVIIAGVLFSFTGFFVIRNREKADIQAEFQMEAKNHTSALEKSIDYKLQVLNSIALFYMSSVSVERGEFSGFVESFLDSSAIEALAWVPRVTDANREQFEKKAFAEGLEDFMIFEFDEDGKRIVSGRRDEYFPIYYLSPEQIITQEYGSMLGYNLGEIEKRVDSINYSRDSGKASITEKIPLPTDTDKFGFLVFVPVYKTASPIGSIEERRKNLTGFAVGLIRIKELIEESLGFISTRGVEIQLFDLEADSDNSFIYGYVPGQSTESVISPKAVGEVWDSNFQYEKTFSVANRKWVIKSCPTPAMISLFTTAEPWGLLFGGLILTALGAAYIIITAKRTTAIEGLVELRTSELNSELNEHKLTEQALRASELQFRTLVENIPGAVFRCHVYPPLGNGSYQPGGSGNNGVSGKRFHREKNESWRSYNPL